MSFAQLSPLPVPSSPLSDPNTRPLGDASPAPTWGTGAVNSRPTKQRRGGRTKTACTDASWGGTSVYTMGSRHGWTGDRRAGARRGDNWADLRLRVETAGSENQKASALEGRNTRSHREVRRCGCGCAQSRAGVGGLATHGDGCAREKTAKEKIAGDPGTRGRAGAGAGLVLGEESSRPCG